MITVHEHCHRLRDAIRQASLQYGLEWLEQRHTAVYPVCHSPVEMSLCEHLNTTILVEESCFRLAGFAHNFIYTMDQDKEYGINYGAIYCETKIEPNVGGNPLYAAVVCTLYLYKQ